MPNKRSLSDDESSDLPERVSLPRHAPKPQPTPKKFKRAPENSEPVSFLSDSDQEKAKDAKASGRRLSFGTVDVKESDQSPADEGHGKRTRKPSEKALYMAEAGTDGPKTPVKKEKSAAVKTPSSSKTKTRHVSESWDEFSDASNARLSKNDRNAAPSESAQRESVKRRRESHNEESTPTKRRADRGDYDTPKPAERQQPLSSSKPGNKGKQRARSPSLAPSNNSEEGDPNADHRRKGASFSKNVDDGKKRARSPSVSQSQASLDVASEDAEDKDRGCAFEGKSTARRSALMDFKYPDMPASCNSFTGFKHLAHTFSLNGRKSNLLSLQSFYDDMHRRDRKGFLDALNFTRAGSFINPSRARAGNLNINKMGRFVFGREENALLLFNGAVAYCSLVEPTTVNGANVRCISIYPFKDDFNQWKKFIAFVVQKFDFITNTDNDVLSFLSRKENSHEDSGCGGKASTEPFSSPKKGCKFFDQQSDDRKGGSNLFNAARIPIALPFNETVPIYDARGTDFSLQEHYTRISSLPLYNDGRDDLPQFAIVTVGHTASTFSYNIEKNVTALQLNVIFVILHGFVKDEE